MIHDFVDYNLARGCRYPNEKKRSDEKGGREKSWPGLVFAGWTGDALMRHRDQSKAFVKLCGRTRQRMKDISQRNAKQLARHVVYGCRADDPSKSRGETRPICLQDCDRTQHRLGSVTYCSMPKQDYLTGKRLNICWRARAIETRQVPFGALS